MNVTAKDIRAWGVANGYRCHTGKLGRQVIDAYIDAHPDAVIDVIGKPTADVAPAEDADEPSYFEVTLKIPGADQADVEMLEALTLDLVMAAFTAGRAAERRDMLASLGVES